MDTKSVGIIGSGPVGRALAAGYLKDGFPVTIGTRSPDKLEEWQKDNPFATVGSFADAAKADLVVLAVKGSAASQAIDQAGPAVLNGKTVIDTTNPIADAPPENGVIQFLPI